MNQFSGQTQSNPDVIRKMRMEVDRGASVYELVQIVQAALMISEDKPIPVLWYFMEAFGLSLPVVLPLREWMGEERDETIDNKIMAAIAAKRSQWTSLLAEQRTA